MIYLAASGILGDALFTACSLGRELIDVLPELLERGTPVCR
jgi:hypothetical protein